MGEEQVEGKEKAGGSRAGRGEVEQAGDIGAGRGTYKVLAWKKKLCKFWLKCCVVKNHNYTDEVEDTAHPYSEVQIFFGPYHGQKLCVDFQLLDFLINSCNAPFHQFR